MAKKGAKGLSPTKARKILHDGEVKGHKLTARQRRFMGAQVSKGARKSGRKR